MSQRSNRIKFGTLVLLAAAGLSAPAMADFNYTNFSSIGGLHFNGNATPYNGNITVSSPTTDSVGSFYHEQMQNISLGFVTDFRFRISDLSGFGADGFAFVIHNSNFALNALGGGRGALGYGRNTVYPGLFDDGIENSLAVEFDLFENRLAYNDFSSDNHVSIQSKGTAVNVPSPDASLGHAIVPWNMSQLESEFDVRIVYTPTIMSVFMKPSTQGSFGAALITANVNLGTLLNLAPGGEGAGRAFVGFTAATTGVVENGERHEIISWAFQGNVIPAPGSVALLGLGGLLAARRRR